MFPPELIDTIVDKVEVMADLKSCCLAASVFRYASQSRLLANLSLGFEHYTGTGKRYDEAVARFEAAPHLASLVVNLTIFVSKSSGTSEVITATPTQLKSLFAALTRVGSCTMASFNHRWEDIPERLSVAVGHWISLVPSGTFHRFHIEGINNVPQQLIHDIFKAIALHCSLSFTMTSTTSLACVKMPSYTPPPFHLRLCSRYADPHLLLTEPSFLRYAQCVSRLTVSAAHSTEIETAFRICDAATRRLEHIRLILSNGMRPPQNDVHIKTPPCLPSLRLLEVNWTRTDKQLKFDHNFSWFLSEILAPILRPEVTPNLAQVNLEIVLYPAELDRAFPVLIQVKMFPSPIDLALLRQLDDILAGRDVLLCFVFSTNCVEGVARDVGDLLEALKDKLPNHARRNLLSVVAQSLCESSSALLTLNMLKKLQASRTE
ncbi:hypothetical protein MIND_00559800 [Mycena indigotica]|uniref:Uncharacterized protein n=1 Tax=Mycena indigotica TaxID=2126181 RepID=A0A8H6T1A5_9AGAR|nr:uncharacterized protein MIND_00559800 [Mycena indigotica]KAF7307645.1 hypothetical protein MIND_00559800 [Mycena indigotica]